MEEHLKILEERLKICIFYELLVFECNYIILYIDFLSLFTYNTTLSGYGICKALSVKKTLQILLYKV